jgi:3-deoxy-D-manno-octulosonic-acid transferase
MSFARAAYSALVYAMLPVVLARLLWRSRREPGYRQHVSERFARYSGPPPTGPFIWIHAVSVGETRAAEPLVKALCARHPGHRIVLTHMTPTGRRMGEMVFGDRVSRCYLPYDYPAAVARFLERYEPRLGVLMETEIWPNLIAACKARGVPTYLVNARLSERSYRRYCRVHALARESAAALTAVAAQSEADASRLRALGARAVAVTGSVKFDVNVPADQIQGGRAWRRLVGSRSVLLAASTREGEESPVLDAFCGVPGSPLIVIVPRHPTRFDEVEALLERRRLVYERRSSGRSVTPETRVLLGDSMGEMAWYYAACDVAYIGGSLLPFGGQNLIEACAVGTPVLIGPHTYNFADAAERAIDIGAALRVRDAGALGAAAARLLADEAARALMAERALAFSRAHQGATGRIMGMLEMRDA